MSTKSFRVLRLRVPHTNVPALEIRVVLDKCHLSPDEVVLLRALRSDASPGADKRLHCALEPPANNDGDIAREAQNGARIDTLE